MYWPFGQPRLWTFGNGKAVTRSFDLDGRMTSNPVGSVVYDAASRITQAYGGTYGYDALDRLTNYSLPPYTSESYSYDANGNRASQTLGSTTRTYSISPSSNRIVSSTSGGSTRTYNYDANGSITSNGVLTLAYDATGRLKTAQGNAEYTNALNQRTLTSLYGFMPRWYAYDERGHLTGSYAFDVTGYFETVFLGDMPIAAVDGYYGVNYIDTDHLGTPRIVTNASQQPVWTWNPGTFGVPSPNMDPGNTGNFYNYYGRFAGQYYSDESSLHYNYFRDYDPSTGRYIESDPIGLRGGINTYAYVDSDPVSKVDPQGLDAHVIPINPMFAPRPIGGSDDPESWRGSAASAVFAAAAVGLGWYILNQSSSSDSTSGGRDNAASGSSSRTFEECVQGCEEDRKADEALCYIAKAARGKRAQRQCLERAANHYVDCLTRCREECKKK